MIKEGVGGLGEGIEWKKNPIQERKRQTRALMVSDQRDGGLKGFDAFSVARRGIPVSVPGDGEGESMLTILDAQELPIRTEFASMALVASHIMMLRLHHWSSITKSGLTIHIYKVEEDES